MSRAYAAAETAGVRAVAVTSTAFMEMQRATAKALGIPEIAIAEYPGVITIDSQEDFDRRVREKVFPSIVEHLRRPVKATQLQRDAEPKPREIVFRGSFDEIQEFFLRNMWSDGLPIVPPTLDRIDRFLRFTDRKPDEVIGVLLPEVRQATVWNVAVNAVMAGCRPEYMPVLLAVVEAISDPGFRIQDAGSTPGWEPLVVLSGPLAEQLKFNVHSGAMRVGTQANTSIGRFLRLYMRNVAGLRPFPGQTDKGTIGTTFNVALAENEAAIEALGWEPYRVDLGFSPDANVVSVQSVFSISPPIYSGGPTPETQLKYITRIFAETCGAWSFTGVNFGKFFPLMIMSPSVAEVFAKHGWTKDDIRNHLYRSLKIPASTMEDYFWHVSAPNWKVKDSVREGTVPGSVYHENDDPDRMVPMLVRPEWTAIVVSGDTGRNQSRIYINNHEQGARVSKVVRLPRNWDALNAEAQ